MTGELVFVTVALVFIAAIAFLGAFLGATITVIREDKKK